MEVTPETIKKAIEDVQAYKWYMHEMDLISIPLEMKKSFRQMFGYEIFYLEDGGYEFNGERNR